jgi:ribosomal protein L37AE/L43A
MNAAAIVEELSAMGVSVVGVPPDRIRLTVQAGDVPAEAVALAREHKPELIAELVRRDQTCHSSIVCPWCQSVDLIDDDAPDGLRCRSCGRMAWHNMDGRGLVRVDWADVHGSGPDDVPVCPTCRRYCDRESVAGVWRCSKCDPQADHRSAATARWLAAAQKIRSRRRSL